MSGKEKFKLHKRFLLTSLEAMLILIVLVFAVKETYAWYIRDTRVQGTNANTSVDYDDVNATFTAYQYDIKEQRVIATDESNSDAFDLEHLPLQSYDMIFRAKNRYTPIVVKVTLSGLALQHKNTVDLIVKRNTSIQDDPASAQSLSPYVSSVLRFTAIGSGNKNDPYSINDVWYPSVGGYVGHQSGTASGIAYDSKTFTTTQTNGNTAMFNKADYITLSLNYTAQQLENGELNVYLYLSYDATLTSAFERQHGLGVGGTIEEVGEVFGLSNDLTEIEARVR